MPVLWPDGRPAAALSIAAVETRMGPAREEDLARLLRAEAATLADRLAHHLTPERMLP